MDSLGFLTKYDQAEYEEKNSIDSEPFMNSWNRRTNSIHYGIDSEYIKYIKQKI